MEKDYLKISKASDLKEPKERALYRLLEIFPGASAWGTLFLVIILSWQRPVWIAVFIIFFDLYWLLRTIYFSFHLKSGYKQMRKNEKIDWVEKLNQLTVNNQQLAIKNWQEIYHLIILPMYKEPLEIVRESFQAIANTDYPKDKIIVVLACEERAGAVAQKTAKAIKEEFGDKFFKFLITFHPANLPGEIAGKGSNETWSTKKVKEIIIDPLKIPYQNIIFSSLDVDTVVLPKYFSCLTWHYLTAEKPTRTSFQPIALFINNIWQAPPFSRVFAFSATFWQTMCQERPEKLITFSSHSMSFEALVDVGFKDPRVVSDDSRIFWQCFLKYDGDYRVQSLFYPISMDANVAKNIFKTAVNVYKQQRRWSYGVGDVPYFLFGFHKNKKIPFKKKLPFMLELIEGHWSWAVASILIFLLGWLPLILGGAEFSQTMISYNLPQITAWILTITMLGLVGSAYLSILLLPPRPPQYGRSKFLILILEWFFLPVIMVFFTSLPALDSQTRWMLGKYMGFWPTEKVRK
ncbi:glycosyltransferase family 2 protein [Patescibacteria group bacterium]|nr:glycosyltransferase family 2 protein [Patescibacteria group bacterium]